MSHDNKINYSIVSFDEGSPYSELWPFVSKCWKEVCGTTAIAFQLSDKDSEISESEFGLIKNVKIESDFHLSLQAQLLRIYAFKFLKGQEDKICIISDADMLPINKQFFLSGLNHYKDGSMTSYYNHLIPDGEITMCYNLASVRDFINLLNLKSFNCFRDFLVYVKNKYAEDYKTVNSNKQKFGWNIDQRYMWDCMQENKDKLITPNYELKRLDRESWPKSPTLESNLLSKSYYDCHFFNESLNTDKKKLANKIINLSKS